MKRYLLLGILCIAAAASFAIAAQRVAWADSETRDIEPTEKETDSEQNSSGIEPIARGIRDLFQNLVDSRHPPGDTNVKRAVFLKPHGCATAQFFVLPLEEDYRVGLFESPGIYDAWIRISSDTVPSVSDFNNNTVGFAVKVLDVPGRKVLPGEEEFTTHDFVLQNHDVFFVDTAADFLEFTESVFSGGVDTYLDAHPTTRTILDDMAKPLESVLDTRYWSTTPYRYGDDAYVKYSAKPCAPRDGRYAPTEDPNYLQARFAADLANSWACFELQAQFQSDEETMPLDRGTVRWSETESSPKTLAIIGIPSQTISAHQGICEDLSFTAWHALPEHRPVGSVNEARGIVYKRMADARRRRNGVPIEEPGTR